jgi:response regulator of citrate/malate metabolism
MKKKKKHSIKEKIITKDKIIRLLQQHPQGLMLSEISDKVGVSRITAAKYVYELFGAQKIDIRKVGIAKLCYLKNKK